MQGKNWVYGEPRIDDVLADPIVKLVMRRDGVGEDAVRDSIGFVAERAKRLAESRTIDGEGRRHHRSRHATGTFVPATPDPAGMRQRVLSIQRQLAFLGYDPGPTDGNVGPETRAAIRAFRATHGLPVAGVITARLEAALTAAANAASRRSGGPSCHDDAAAGRKAPREAT